MSAWSIHYEDWKRQEDYLNSFPQLNNLTLYWMTGCAPSSIMAYYGNFNTLPKLGEIKAPIGIARFPHDILPVPKDWIEQNYNLIQFSEMPYGGHFTAMEAAVPFAEALKKFINKL